MARSYEFNGRRLSPFVGNATMPLVWLVVVVTYPLHLLLRALGRVGFASYGAAGDEKIFTYSITAASFRRT